MPADHAPITPTIRGRVSLLSRRGVYCRPAREASIELTPQALRHTKVTSNSRWLSHPVYGDLLDRVVWASPGVLIGAAFRGGAPLDSYFVLARTGR